MSKHLWYAAGALVGTVAVIKLFELSQESDVEAYKKKIAADAIRVVQDNLTKQIVNLPD